MGEGGETGSRGHLSVQFGGRHGRRNHHLRGCGVALEVVSYCPGLQGSSPELLRNNVGLGLIVLSGVHVANARTVRVGIPGHNITQAAFYAARDRGWYREEGLEAQLIMMPAPVRNLALIAGNVDFHFGAHRRDYSRDSRRSAASTIYQL